MMIHTCAREEREAGASEEEKVISIQTGLSGRHQTGLSGRHQTGLSGPGRMAHRTARSIPDRVPGATGPRQNQPGEESGSPDHAQGGISGRRLDPDYPAPGLSGLA